MNGPAVILIALKILAVLVLVLLNAFFVVAELAMVRIRDSQLTSLAQRATAAPKLRGTFSRTLTPTSARRSLASRWSASAWAWRSSRSSTICWSRCSIWPASVRIAAAQHRVGVGFFTNCYLLIVAGELVPKAVAIRRTLPAALWTASPLVWFYRLAYPFIWLLNRSSQMILKWLGIGADELHGAQSEDELRVILAGAQGSPDRRNLILNALDLRHRTAREVMRPRNEVTVFDSAATVAECLAVAEKTRYSRFPICDNGDPDKARA